MTYEYEASLRNQLNRLAEERLSPQDQDLLEELEEDYKMLEGMSFTAEVSRIHEMRAQLRVLNVRYNIK